MGGEEGEASSNERPARNIQRKRVQMGSKLEGVIEAYKLPEPSTKRREWCVEWFVRIAKCVRRGGIEKETGLESSITNLLTSLPR